MSHVASLKVSNIDVSGRYKRYGTDTSLEPTYAAATADVFFIVGDNTLVTDDVSITKALMTTNLPTAN